MFLGWNHEIILHANLNCVNHSGYKFISWQHYFFLIHTSNYFFSYENHKKSINTPLKNSIVYTFAKIISK